MAAVKTSSRQRRKKLAITVYITPEQDRRLRRLHERTMVPIAAYVRQGIDLVLKKAGG
jgi:predicted DNA-binding protein